MKTENENTGDHKNKGHSHAKHMWMMAVCCGLPIIGFLVIGAIGISMPSLETLLLIICPIGMIGMMYMMHRDSQQKGSACCDSKESTEGTVIDPPPKPEIDSGRGVPKQTGSLEA